MKSFQKIPECNKCGSVEVFLKYISAVAEDEHIMCTCKICDHSWKMKVKDAGQAKEPTEIVESKV